MKTMETLRQISDYLPAPVRAGLLRLPEDKRTAVQEIRLRCGRPMQAVRGGSAFTVTAQGLCTGASGGIAVRLLSVKDASVMTICGACGCTAA